MVTNAYTGLEVIQCMANTSLLYKKLSALSVKGKGTSKEEFKPQAFRKEYGVIILSEVTCLQSETLPKEDI